MIFVTFMLDFAISTNSQKRYSKNFKGFISMETLSSSTIFIRCVMKSTRPTEATPKHRIKGLYIPDQSSQIAPKNNAYAVNLNCATRSKSFNYQIKVVKIHKNSVSYMNIYVICTYGLSNLKFFFNKTVLSLGNFKASKYIVHII